MQEVRQERRLRRKADQLGLALRKSRSRTPEVPEYGTYGLTDPWTSTWVSDGFGWSLDDVEEYLRAREA